MKLYLVQHAKAVEKQIDPERPITKAGRLETQTIASFIEPLKLKVDSLWHSGKKRAAQTAEMLAKVIDAEEITAHDGLAPNDDVLAIKEQIVSSGSNIMIVGHLPFLGKLASLLLCENEFAGTVNFENSGIVCLGSEQDRNFQIEWIITPELIAG